MKKNEKVKSSFNNFINNHFIDNVTSKITIQEKLIESPKSPRIFKTLYYEDNTIFLQLTRLELPIHYPNGTINAIDISMEELDIQPLNFCFASYNDENAVQINAYPLRTYAVKDNFLLLTYVKAENSSDPYTYSDWAMTIDLNGKIRRLEKINFSFKKK